MVFLVNPLHLRRRRRDAGRPSPEITPGDRVVRSYLRLDGRGAIRGGLPTIAVTPVWNSERLVAQRGAFTLHGSSQFALDSKQAASLVGIPIPAGVKERLRRELGRIGVDEMTVFPELEHACRHLKWTSLW